MALDLRLDAARLAAARKMAGGEAAGQLYRAVNMIRAVDVRHDEAAYALAAAIVATVDDAVRASLLGRPVPAAAGSIKPEQAIALAKMAGGASPEEALRTVGLGWVWDGEAALADDPEEGRPTPLSNAIAALRRVGDVLPAVELVEGEDVGSYAVRAAQAEHRRAERAEAALTQLRGTVKKAIARLPEKVRKVVGLIGEGGSAPEAVDLEGSLVHTIDAVLIELGRPAVPGALLVERDRLKARLVASLTDLTRANRELAGIRAACRQAGVDLEIALQTHAAERSALEGPDPAWAMLRRVVDAYAETLDSDYPGGAAKDAVIGEARALLKADPGMATPASNPLLGKMARIIYGLRDLSGDDPRAGLPEVEVPLGLPKVIPAQGLPVPPGRPAEVTREEAGPDSDTLTIEVPAWDGKVTLKATKAGGELVLALTHMYGQEGGTAVQTDLDAHQVRTLVGFLVDGQCPFCKAWGGHTDDCDAGRVGIGLATARAVRGAVAAHRQAVAMQAGILGHEAVLDLEQLLRVLDEAIRRVAGGARATPPGQVIPLGPLAPAPHGVAPGRIDSAGAQAPADAPRRPGE